MRDDMPVFQDFDTKRSLIGQTLKHRPRYGGGSTTGKPFVVESLGYAKGWYYRDPDQIACHGHQVRKDGTIGSVNGECLLDLNEVPTVDLEMLIRGQRNRAVGELRQAFARINELRNVLTERRVKLSPSDLEVDAYIAATIDLHAVSASGAKDDDD